MMFRYARFIVSRKVRGIRLVCCAGVCPELSFVVRKINVLIEMKEERN